MKKTALLNSALSGLIASLGHQDLLVIGDAGLPIPHHTRRIDLALTRGVPGFLQTVQVVLEEMQVELAIVAEETREVSPHIDEELHRLLPGVEFSYLPHEELKRLSGEARVVVRTGEFTPYANVVLRAGVVF